MKIEGLRIEWCGRSPSRGLLVPIGFSPILALTVSVHDLVISMWFSHWGSWIAQQSLDFQWFKSRILIFWQQTRVGGSHTPPWIPKVRLLKSRLALRSDAQQIKCLLLTQFFFKFYAIHIACGCRERRGFRKVLTHGRLIQPLHKVCIEGYLVGYPCPCLSV